MADRMNFGCGTVRPDGWVNVDRTLHTPGERHLVVADVLVYLPFDDCRFDYIVANHSLQQLGHPEAVLAGLVELRRVLKDDGVLRIMVPDVVAAFRAYTKGDRKWFPNRENHTTLDETFCAYVTWYGTNTTVFTIEYLMELTARAGFGAVGECWKGMTLWSDDKEITELDDRDGESIYVEAMK